MLTSVRECNYIQEQEYTGSVKQETWQQGCNIDVCIAVVAWMGWKWGCVWMVASSLGVR